jgi:hypothetical protein
MKNKDPPSEKATRLKALESGWGREKSSLKRHHSQQLIGEGWGKPWHGKINRKRRGASPCFFFKRKIH